MRHSPLATTAVLAVLLAAGVSGATAGTDLPLSGPRIVYGSNAPSSPSDAAYPVAQGYGEPAAPRARFQPIGFPSGSYRGFTYGSGLNDGFMPPIPPAGGLAVYSPGAYGPGPRIIRIPRGYGTRPAHRLHGCCGASAGSD